MAQQLAFLSAASRPAPVSGGVSPGLRPDRAADARLAEGSSFHGLKWAVMSSAVALCASKKMPKSTLKPGGKFNLADERKAKVKRKKREGYEMQYDAGAMAPMGAWDPLNFVNKEKTRAKENFFRFRQAEIKHGRVAMLAVVGELVQHFLYLPFFETTGKGLGALSNSAGQLGFSLIVVASGYLELVVFTEEMGKKRPGAYGDPLGVAKLLDLEDGADNLDMQNKELNNGRLAMIGIMLTFILEKATGYDAVDQLINGIVFTA